MEWVYAPRGDVLSQFEFRYVDPQKEKGLEGSDLPRAIEHGLDELISKLPFLGQVTGVEGETITVNLGRNQNVQPGEIFVIGTIDSVRRHPILNTIEEWRWNKVGRAQVEQVEESICFAKIIETEPKETVIRFQKIREILPAPAEENHEKSSKSFEREIPRIGWVAGNLGIGNYSREVGAGSSTGRTGGGLLGAVELDSQFWLNSRWLGQASFSESLFHYGAQDIATSTNTATYGGHASQFRLAAGYSLFPAKTVFDSIAWILLGYRSTNYSLTQQSSDYTGSSTISSLFMGLGGEVPLDGGLTAQLGIDIGLFKSASADSLTSLSGWGTPDSVSDIMVTAGFTYHFEDQIFLRLLFKFNSQSIDFTGGTTGQTLSQKMFTLSPSIMYYF